MRPRTVPHRGFNLEYLMWLFTRLSALAMYALAFTGITGALVMGARSQMDLAALMRWAFMPNVNHVTNTNVINLDTWQTVFWQAAGILFLFFAGTHGINGLRVVVEDYLRAPAARLIWRGFIFLLWIAALVVAVYVILGS